MSSIKRRGGAWRGRAELGVDPVTGKRRILSVTAKTKAAVEARLRELLADADKGDYIDPAKTTFGEWLDKWFTTACEGSKRPRTCERYAGVIKNHLKPALGNVVLQRLQAVDLEEYYKNSPLSGATLALHHTVTRSALDSAVRKRILRRNEAALVDGRPHARDKGDTTEIRENCWDAEEARRFLKAAREAGPQQAAFYSLELELGLRKNEIAALMWDDVDFEAATVRLVHQLSKPSAAPEFVPLKSGSPRTLDLSDEIVELLKAHRQHQAEIRMRNRQAYHDLGLVFAKEARVKSAERLGNPLQTNNIAEREFDGLVKAAGVRRIRFHGMRHTSATLALAAGVSVKIVAHRLGHSKTSITLDLYMHVIPSMSKDAARKIGALLHR